MGSAQDIAPLAWVIDEIRASLGQAVDSVKAFQADRQDAEPLRNARNQVHQAHGALQLLDLRGVALVTEAIEHLLHRWESEPKECGPSATRTLENAVAATLNYLAGLMSGRPNQPIRLYPYYRDLLALNRAARIHPADLIFPDLSRRPAFHKIEVKPLTANQLRMRRVSFEEGLLGFLRNADDPPARRTMRDAIAELEHLPQRGLARSFWWVARGLLDALAAGQLPVDIDLKRVLARLNLRLRRLIEGGGAVSERLMTDVLYYVGRGSGEVPRVAEVRQLYGLEALIVPDFERPTLTAIDADALRQLKDGVALAKQHWGRIVGGAAELPRFAQELSRCIEAAGRLEAAAIGSVLRNVGVATRDFADLAPGARESLGLEVASALLFVEQSADELPQACPGPPDHDQRGGRDPRHAARNRTTARPLLPQPCRPQRPAGHRCHVRPDLWRAVGARLRRPGGRPAQRPIQRAPPGRPGNAWQSRGIRAYRAEPRRRRLLRRQHGAGVRPGARHVPLRPVDRHVHRRPGAGHRRRGR